LIVGDDDHPVGWPAPADGEVAEAGLNCSRSHPESKRSVYNSRWKSSKISQKSPSDGHVNEHFI
jgi:hypothetical protein